MNVLAGTDHLATVRAAVAGAVPKHQPRLRARILAGEMDDGALMRAGAAAAQAVLKGLFS